MIRKQWSTWDAYTIPSSFLSARLAILLFVGDLVLGILGYMWIEDFRFSDAFYMVMITISTVGYTEVQPLTEPGRLFTSVYILANIGVFAYSLSVFTYYVIQGEIFKTMHSNLINKKIEGLNNHIIICGFGRYGREMANHFYDQNLPFVIIDHDAEKIAEIQVSEERLLYVLEDATHDEALLHAGIERAQAIICALPDDSDNVFIVLTARQLNPYLNIISRAKHSKTQKKLLKAGADHVVMPEQIGGFYMATLVSKPGAVEFFTFLTNEAQSDIGFEEITFENLPFECQNKSIRDLNIRKATGANIIGFKQPGGEYVVNPSPDTIIIPNSSFIVLGDSHQLNQLRTYLLDVK